MNFKKLFPLILITISTLAFSQESTTKIKFYGYIGNDFFFNSRQNLELVDGTVQLFPKPIELSAGVDKNAVAQAEMLSINTRLGMDIAGDSILGAKSSGKIEADFNGFGTSYYVLRIRQAYMKLNWNKTELLIGQTWHPLFENVIPATFSSNAGGPFQPFNRSPQVRLKYKLSSTLTLTGAALYEMQYASQGPLGTINTYLKDALLPDLFLGLENKTSHWTTGIGADFKTIKPDANSISSLSGIAYAQYTNPKFQLKGKVTYGENLSDQLMLGGYGVSKFAADSTTVLKYTNFNNLSSWISAAYGTKIQVGIVLGLSENLGTNDMLDLGKGKKITAYGYGFYSTTQQILDKLYRIAPHVDYNLPNMKFALEYDLTKATYGTIQTNGSATNPYSVSNNRVLASVMYIF